MPQFFGGIHDIYITGIMNLMNCDTDTGVIFLRGHKVTTYKIKIRINNDFVVSDRQELT